MAIDEVEKRNKTATDGDPYSLHSDQSLHYNT